MDAASDATFGAVFGAFLVASVVLIVLVVRFTMQRAAASRTAWVDGTGASGPGAADGSRGDDDHEDEPERSLTALVLGGGGTRGALQIGMLQVLAEHGFVPDRIYGTSVGAVNAAGFAGDPSREGVERMTEIWRGLTRASVYPQGRLHGPWLYFQQRDSVFANTGLRKIIEEGVAFERLEDAVIPLEVVATSLTDGRERWFTYGPVAEAVLASAAVPTIFPPVEIDGERYIDGGVVNNVPIQRAIDAGATRIVVLLCSPPVYRPASYKRPVESLLEALLISIHARFPRDLVHLPEGVEVIVCAGDEGSTRDFDDFSTTEALITQGREEAAEIVRRYGIAGPGPAGSGSSAAGGPAGEVTAGARSDDPTSAMPPGGAGSVDGGGWSDGDVPVGAETSSGAALTQPEPGT